ncbi:MAG: hypothetical protein ACYCYF_02590 [Anaerolineae bacterium]
MSQQDVGGRDADRVDVSLLSEMVGVRRGLAVIVDKGVAPTREVVLAMMETEKAVYIADGGFPHKEQALALIIAAFQEGRLSVADVMRAVGIDTSRVKPRAGLLKRLFGT